MQRLSLHVKSFKDYLVNRVSFHPYAWQIIAIAQPKCPENFWNKKLHVTKLSINLKLFSCKYDTKQLQNNIKGT